jgi:hypothetical protein
MRPSMQNFTVLYGLTHASDWTFDLDLRRLEFSFAVSFRFAILQHGDSWLSLYSKALDLSFKVQGINNLPNFFFFGSYALLVGGTISLGIELS